MLMLMVSNLHWSSAYLVRSGPRQASFSSFRQALVRHDVDRYMFEVPIRTNTEKEVAAAVHLSDQEMAEVPNPVRGTSLVGQ